MKFFLVIALFFGISNLSLASPKCGPHLKKIGVKVELKNLVDIEGEDIFLKYPDTAEDVNFLDKILSLGGVDVGLDEGLLIVSQIFDPESRTRLNYFGAWIVEYEGQRVGFINLVRQHEEKSAFVLNVGYVIHPNFQGQGLATQALNLVKQFAFENLGAEKIYAHTTQENKASQGVLRKSGFHEFKKENPRHFQWFRVAAQP